MTDRAEEISSRQDLQPILILSKRGTYNTYRSIIF
jgi:hypothetical protein